MVTRNLIKDVQILLQMVEVVDGARMNGARGKRRREGTAPDGGQAHPQGDRASPRP